MLRVILARRLSVLSPREAVSELRVGELVESAGRRYAEVSPHVFAAAEVQLLHRAGARLETLHIKVPPNSVVSVYNGKIRFQLLFTRLFRIST